MSDDAIAPPREVGLYRAAIGLAQGLVLYALLQAKLPPFLNTAILPVVVFVPLLVIQGWRAIAPRTLAVWAGLSALGIVGLALYAEYRRVPVETTLYGVDAVPEQLWPALIVILFISQALISAASAEGRRIASYQRNFETVSSQAIQVVASAAFTGALMLSLFLGAELFQLIKIDFLNDLMEKEWFVIPVITLAVSVALHVTDVRPGIIRGIRTLALTLLSWLLPLMALLALGFVASLPFTGLEALWATRNATVILLVVAGALTVFINAAYQDGATDQARGVFRMAMPVAAVLLTPLAVLAAVALGLRVGQYGWTNDRVAAAACIVIATCTALGYGWAVITTLRGKSAWLKPVETTNITTSFVALAVLIALLTPVADPARIGTASQMARIESGRTPAAEFDFKYLRFDAARYGRAALEKLAALRESETGKQAAEALTMKNRFDREKLPETTLAAQITVYPVGERLPDSFLAKNWTSRGPERLPGCLVARNVACDARLLDIDQDGTKEVLLQSAWPLPTGGLEPYVIHTDRTHEGTIFREDASHNWAVWGYFSAHVPCGQLERSFRENEVLKVPSQLPDLEIAGTRMKVRVATPESCIPDPLVERGK